MALNIPGNSQLECQADRPLEAAHLQSTRLTMRRSQYSTVARLTCADDLGARDGNPSRFPERLP
jgi:hypothetical protein